VASLPGARGDGQPVTTLVDVETGTQLVHYFAGPTTLTLLLSGSGGYGFVCCIDNLISRNKGGKAFINLAEGETLCVPSLVGGGNGATPLPIATHVACASAGGRILTFDIGELKAMEKGGRGLMLMDLDAKDSLAGAAAYTRSISILGVGRGGKDRAEALEIRSLNNAKGSRARKGKAADFGFKPTHVLRVE
jgi:topoisomerase-4 subunit A